ncbi:MAG TPA: hypothetical protein VLQ93_04265, partial [Myxococcaceae bacterium]|nr:hypothetical protein [Myxococcaceae bacterium]
SCSSSSEEKSGQSGGTGRPPQVGGAGGSTALESSPPAFLLETHRGDFGAQPTCPPAAVQALRLARLRQGREREGLVRGNPHRPVIPQPGGGTWARGGAPGV